MDTNKLIAGYAMMICANDTFLAGSSFGWVWLTFAALASYAPNKKEEQPND